jgi:cytochrome c-type biogenesis protein CcmF
VLSAIGLGVAAWLIVGAIIDLAGRLGVLRVSLVESWRRAANLPRSAWGTAFAHAGLGIFVAGVTASSSWQTEKIQLMRKGDTVPLSGYTITFEGATELKGPNYDAVRGGFTVRRGDRVIARLKPEKRFYPAEQSQTTEAAIHTTWMADIYTVLGDRDESGAWTTRFYHNPLVPWIWAGVMVMALGGGISLTDRRLRVGAPRRARRNSSRAASPVPTGS